MEAPDHEITKDELIEMTIMPKSKIRFQSGDLEVVIAMLREDA